MSVVGDFASERSARRVPSRSSVNCGARRSTGVPAASARLTAGRLARSSRAVPWTSSEIPARRVRNGRLSGSDSIPVLQRARRARDRVAQRLRIARQRLERVGHAGEAARERVRQRREHAGDVGGLVEQPLEARVGVGERAHHRRQVAEQLRRGAERAVDRRAAARERGAEVVEVAVDVVARGLVEDREEVVELGADGVRARRDRRALGQRPRRTCRARARRTSARAPSAGGSARCCRAGSASRTCRASASAGRRCGRSGIGSIFATWPTRKPPSRTSLPTTRRAAFGVSTFTSNVGTNGSPWLAW